MDTVSKISAFGESLQLVWSAASGEIVPPRSGLDSYCDEQQFYLNINGVAKYQIKLPDNSLTIEVDPELTNLDAVNTWLYGTVFAYLLQAKGYLVLHGSAVLVNGGAVIFSGDSGAGKSTTAAGLVKLGYPLLTDDVVVIKATPDGKMVLKPGPSRVKLWQDALVQFGQSADQLKPIANKANKYELPISYYHAEEVPVLQFYELTSSADCAQIIIRELSGHAKFTNLIRNTYRYSMLGPLNKLKLHLTQVAQLSSLIKVYTVERPKDKFLLDELLQEILKRFVTF